LSDNAGLNRVRIALLPWGGDLIEDFLDTIGVSLEGFRDEMSGGWLFGYVDALARVGVETVIVCISSRVRKPERWTHRATGATMCILPPSGGYARLRAGVERDRARHAPRGCPSISHRMRERLCEYLATPPRALARTLRGEECRAIVCQEYEEPRFDVCVVLGRLLGLPVFGSFQGRTRHSRVEQPVRVISMRAVNGLIIGSRTEVQRVQKQYALDSSKIARIFNPLDPAEWAPRDRTRARQALGLHSAGRVVVWHGRVDFAQKGIDVLLDAWELLRGRVGGGLTLLLVGTGSDAAALRRRITRMQRGDIAWVDEYVVDRPRLRQYLAAADVYALPSLHEGFPVAPIEAMASGLPVVAADAPGVRDIFDQAERSGGIIVPRGDAVCLSRALERLLQDEQLRLQFGQNARRRVEEAFSLEAVGQQLRDFFVARGVAM
jgi:glycosyltransferase involved in cell wall biosynthesis